MAAPIGTRDLPRMIFEWREYAFSRYTIAFSRVHARPVSDFGRGLPCENSSKTLLVVKTSESDVTDHPPWWFTARKRRYVIHVRWIRQFCVMESLKCPPIMFDITLLSFLWDQKLKYSKPCIGFRSGLTKPYMCSSTPNARRRASIRCSRHSRCSNHAQKAFHTRAARR